MSELPSEKENKSATRGRRPARASRTEGKTKSAQRYYSSVSPKGQITLPMKVRRALGIKPKDRVAIEIAKDNTVRISVTRSRLLDHFQMAPPLDEAKRKLSWREIVEIAADDHAEQTSRPADSGPVDNDDVDAREG